MSLNTRDYTLILWILQWTLCEAMMLISPRLTLIVSWKLIVHFATAVIIMSARLFMTHVWQFFLLHWMLICWWHKTTNRSTSDFNILTHEMNCDLKYTILHFKIYWLLKYNFDNLTGFDLEPWTAKKNNSLCFIYSTNTVLLIPCNSDTMCCVQ